MKLMNDIKNFILKLGYLFRIGVNSGMQKDIQQSGILNNILYNM